MTVLHATEPADRLPLGGRPGRRGHGRRRRPPRSTTTAPWSSSSPCAAPCSSSRATCCPRRGAAPSARVADQLRRRLAKDVEAAGLATRRRGLARRGRAPRVLDALARGRRASPPELRARVPELAGPCVDLGTRQVLRRERPDRPAGAHPARGVEGAIVRGRNDGHWRISRPPLDADGPVAGRRTRRAGPARTGTPSWCAAGWPPSAPAPTDDLQWWLGATRPVRSSTRWRRSRPSRCPSTGRHRLGAARRPRRAGAGRAVGGAAAGARPDPDGLEAARLLPRPRHVPYLFDTQRQRRHHRLVGRPGRRLLGAGRRRGGARGPCARTSGRTARRRSRTEAERLTAWLDGTRISSVYASPQMKSALLP